MNRIMRIIVGLGLIAYGIYSGNAWFYLGIVPLLTGIINWCPMQIMMGDCKDGQCNNGTCGTTEQKEKETSCCSDDNNASCCSTPTKNVAMFSATKPQENTSCCSVPNNNEKTQCCSTPKKEANINGKMVVKILGTGCAKCKELKNKTDQAVEQLSLDIEVIKVEDLNEIMSYNIIAMPGFVINEEVISAGKVYNVDEIKELLEKEK